jgi:hypothetical protein
MNPSDEFQRKIDSSLTLQAQHDEQILALIRVAELQQSNCDRRDESISDIASALAQERYPRVERQNEMAERQKSLDDRIDRLGSAMGELARRQ